MSSRPRPPLRGLLGLPILFAALIGAGACGLGAATAVAAPPVAVSPMAGTPDASPQTQISLLGPRREDLGQVSVLGSRSGVHSGRLAAYTGDRGASFLPNRPFVPGESVRVRVTGSAADPGLLLHFSFTVARPAPSHPIPLGSGPSPHARGPLEQSFVSRPDLRPSALRFTVNRSAVAPGDLFMTPIVYGPPARGRQHGPMIVDRQGRLVWFDPIDPTVLDFRPQVYLGRPVLTWWQGRFSNGGFGRGHGIIVDSSYRPVAVVGGGNGYLPDLHEFQLSPGGSAFVTAYSPVQADLRSVGGPGHGSVLDTIVQEIDVKTGLVMWEWHSLGHISLRDSYLPRHRGYTWDAFHTNSVQDDGASILISARNTWTVYDVSLRTGSVLWRLGGKHSNFRFGRGARFAWQHDAALHPHHVLTVFDNEAAPQVGRRSRGLILSLRLRARRVRLLRSYVHRPAVVLSGSEGDVQLLPGGNVLLGFGSQPYMTEFTRGGRIVFDAHFPRPTDTYRTFRYPWSGHPRRPPDAVLRHTGRGRVTVYASWNGATDVAAWQVLAGASPQTMTPVAGSPRVHFETVMPVSTSAPYLAARALSATGQVLGVSALLRR